MYTDIPIVAISSIPQETALKRFGKLKIDGYIQKDTFNQNDFTNLVREILTKHHI